MPTANEESGKSPERATDAFPRGVWLAGAAGLLLVGWAFILFWNGFHVTAPVVFVCLGYGAGVAAVYSLFRTGAAAVSAPEDEGDDDAGWGRPVGARAELEREKKALLKAIKEAEFDLQMGKLSKADAEAMIGTYRAQALAVIREIDRKESGDASAREEIEREVRARLEVAKAKKAAEDRRPQQGKKGKKQPAAAAKQADAPKAAEEPAAKADEAAAKTEVAPAEAEVAPAEADEAAAKADEAGGGEDKIHPPGAAAATAGEAPAKEATS